MNTIFTRLRVGICAVAAMTLGGCLSSTPHWDATFGDSVTQLRAMQTLNPDASANRDAVAGVDGKSAVSAQTSYGKSFSAPQSPVNMFTIGVGSSQY
ncbi:hypothetical protein [Paraburkholderia sp.]|uniref:hypothetical protein n=1 Tax=Paraburkholderia sp. TaxID=1926495 RepID=UPI0023A249B5|nr:hypothetical protein [Paraburkholderia sp.]MDE1181674.1 hypothetical protein [Paraburkholderia sp.]